jgi:hypothetical protein
MVNKLRKTRALVYLKLSFDCQHLKRYWSLASAKYICIAKWNTHQWCHCGKCLFNPWIALRNCLIMMIGMTSASTLGNTPQMSAGCIVHISQASQFAQEDDLRLCITSGARFLWTVFYTYVLKDGGKVSWVTGSSCTLARDACCRQQKSSDEKQRKLQLSGLVVTRACVAFARSSWDNSGCSLNTFCCWKGDSFSYHIRHMVCQRKGTRSAALMSWLGVSRPHL